MAQDTPAVGDLYIAEHRMWRDKFCIVRIEHVTSQMAEMSAYRPVTRFGMKGEGEFESSHRRKLSNLRQRLPADADVPAIAARLDELHLEQDKAHKEIRRDYIAAINALGGEG